MVVLDRQGRIVRLNPACEEATGYSFEEVRGKCARDLFLIPEEIEPVEEVLRELQAGHFPNKHENHWLTKNGDRRLIAWSNTAIADSALPGIIADREIDHLNWADAIRDCFLTNCDSVKVETDPTQCALGKWLRTEQARDAYEHGNDKFKKAYDSMLASHRKLHESAVHIVKTYAPVHEGPEQILLNSLLDHKTWVENVTKAIIEGRSEIGVETDHTKCKYGQFLTSRECAEFEKDFPAFREAVQASKEPHRKLHAAAIGISTALADKANGRAESEKIFQGEVLPSLASVEKCFNNAITAEQRLVDDQSAAHKTFEEQTLPLLKETLSDLDGMKVAAETDLRGMNEASDIYAGETLPFLKQTQALLHNVRDKVKSSIMTEEAMLNAAQATKRNVGVVGVLGMVAGIVLAVLIAVGIIRGLKRIINSITEGSEQVSSASAQVSSASQSLAEGASEQAAGLEETSSSLEEMASMTKRNAESAHEANTLAVVAEEVRNLAMRSAEAAKNASAMIEESVKNSESGVNIAGEVASMLEEITTASGKVNDLVAEIAAASQEQAQGIEQVNTAVTQMDKVTQQNAANAEESASASEELNAQAAQMNTIVGELMALVGGSTAHAGTTAKAGTVAHTAVHHLAAAHMPTGTAASKDSQTSHKKAIPFDEDSAVTVSEDFGDFNS